MILPIKQKWFLMILHGKKPEEYREFKPYYKVRFAKLFKLDNDTALPISQTKAAITFRNGYSSNSPSFTALCSLEYREGNPAWGAEQGEKYYVLVIHDICDVSNASEKGEFINGKKSCSLLQCYQSGETGIQ